MKRMAVIVMALCSTVRLAFGQFQPQPVLSDQEALLKSEAGRYKVLMNSMRKPASDLNIDVTYYKLNLAITTSPAYLRGIVTMKASSVVGRLTSVTLDQMNTMIVDSVKTGTSKLSFTRPPATLTIALDRSYGSGEPVSVDIYYQGVPGSSGFGSFTFSSRKGDSLL